MYPFLTDDGKVMVPMRAESDGVIGDGWVELKPGEPGYAEVRAWLERERKV